MGRTKGSDERPTRSTSSKYARILTPLKRKILTKHHHLRCQIFSIDYTKISKGDLKSAKITGLINTYKYLRDGRKAEIQYGREHSHTTYRYMYRTTQQNATTFTNVSYSISALINNNLGSEPSAR